MVIRPLALAGLLLTVLAGVGGPLPGPGGNGAGGSTVAGDGAASGDRSSSRTTVSAALDRAALAFLPDAGGSRFVARGLGYDVTVSSDEVLVAGAASPEPVRMRLVGARPGVVPNAHDPLPGRTNLLLGDDPSQWRAGLTTFGGLGYAGVWDGIDVVYRGQGPRLQYDFVVAPGADTGAVELDFPGTSGVRVTGEGELELALGGGVVRMARPVLYQEAGGSRRPVPGSFDLRGDGRVGFSVGDHDRALPLVIDPVVLDSTYLGGSGADLGYGVAVDGDGSVYVVGSTESPDFPAEGPQQPGLIESADVRTDAFVAKVNPAGDGFVYSTFLGGSGRDAAYGVAVGADGSAYVTGDTDSIDFPMARPAQRTPGGATDGFVAKLAPQGAVLQYSSYLGGTAADLARGIAVDRSGSAFVVGSTTSGNFPVAGIPLKGAQSLPEDTDAFVTKVDASGSAWAWSTYLGGSAQDHAVAVALDDEGYPFVTGDTRSPDFPLAAPFQAASASPGPGPNGVPPDAFVSKLDVGGSSLVYSTYLGGAEADQGADIAVDGAGNAYVTGSTGSTNFPAVGAPQPQKDDDFDAFVTKLNAEGSALAYSTYFGGSGADGGASVSVDGEGRASVTGATASSDLRTVLPFQAARARGSLDGFVATYDADGTRPLLATYLGADGDDQGVAVAAARDGALVVVGYTTSTDFPTASPLQDSRGGGPGDAFLTRVGDAPAAAASDSPFLPGRERRVQILVGSTVALLLAAGLQTLWLRRRPPPEVPAPVPVGAGATGLAVTRLDPQAEWLASATPPARPTAFPNLGARPRPVPAPPLKRRRPSPAGDADQAPGDELAVPDLLADSGKRPSPVARAPVAPAPEPAPAPPPARVPAEVEAEPVDETEMWAPRDADPPRPHVGADPVDGRAGTGDFDLLDPTLWGTPEPEPELGSDPGWWEFLVDDPATTPAPPKPPTVPATSAVAAAATAAAAAAGAAAAAARAAAAAAAKRPTAPAAKRPAEPGRGATLRPASSAPRAPSPESPPAPPAPPATGAPPSTPPSPAPEPETPAHDEDWVADLWAAGQRSKPTSAKGGERRRRAGPPPAEPERATQQSPPVDPGRRPGELSMSDLLGEDLPIPDVPARGPDERSVRALIDEDPVIADPSDPPATDDVGPATSPAEPNSTPPAARQEPDSEPAPEPDPELLPRPLPEAAPGRPRRPWSRWTPRR